MNASQLLSKLEMVEVNGKYDGDTRRMMQDERVALAAAVRSGDGQKIQASMAESKRVAEMWGVEL